MRKLSALLPVFFALACGGGDKPVETPTTTTTSPSASTPAMSASAAASSTPSALPSGKSAYTFLVGAVGCWRGGEWASAEGEKAGPERQMAVQARCADVGKMLSGTADAKVEQLRALEPAVTDTIPAKVGALAKDDKLDQAHTDGLVKLATAVISAEREALLARRASEKVKGDIEKMKSDKDKDAAREKDADKLSADEAATAGQLKPAAALDALMKLDAGDYTHDAKAIALLIGISRADHARGLPKHLQLFAIQGAFKTVFGVAAPAGTDDPTAKLKPGTLLTYVTDVAKAAGHPVPDTAKTPQERFRFAWSGLTAGFADKIKAEQPQTQGELSNVLVVAASHIDAMAQLEAQRAASLAQPPANGAGKDAGKDKDKDKKTK